MRRESHGAECTMFTPLISPKPTPKMSPLSAVGFTFALILIALCTWHSPLAPPSTSPSSRSALFRGGPLAGAAPTAVSPGVTVLRHTAMGWETELIIHHPRLCEDPALPVKQQSGYFNINSTENKMYFFWFIEARHDPLNVPTVLWLSGGPGASSMFALLGENGPCRVDEHSALDENGVPIPSPNPFSWTEAANVVWVDQPAGTGFSMGALADSEHQVAGDMHIFLQTFFKHFPQYGQSVYIIGESFGGHYVPAIAQRIVQMNSNVREPRAAPDFSLQDFSAEPSSTTPPPPPPPQVNSLIEIPLKGIAIGNGITNTVEQMRWLPQMAFNSSTAPRVVNETVYHQMLEALPEVTEAVQACAESNQEDTCVDAFALYNDKLMAPVVGAGINVYDLRRMGTYNMSAIQTYLNSPAVHAQLGALKAWSPVNVSVWRHLSPTDFLHSFHGLIPPVLRSGAKVMIYAGDQDFICNWLGNAAWTNHLEWENAHEYLNAPTIDWVGGTVKSFGNLAFVRVSGAGHMVPMDQPANSLRMLRALIAEGNFSAGAFVDVLLD